MLKGFIADTVHAYKIKGPQSSGDFCLEFSRCLTESKIMTNTNSIHVRSAQVRQQTNFYFNELMFFLLFVKYFRVSTRRTDERETGFFPKTKHKITFDFIFSNE